ncbi:uncharacterized protein LOC121377568 isoform X1 [Gigantopelta aegis]|uniref:uncharacterized protein LOC121377568 isoform X1 n=1 Tax=Gigantopelta aegis TaxID=1735272 RepID=UPI001B88CA4D|nr:uncharacterized protein LOC121377568 isoform X1 [Gigantopelta aegis]
MSDDGPDGNLNAGMGDEFMVAADLTLYGNPLRCLTSRKKKPEPKPEQAKEQKPEKKADQPSNQDKKGGEKTTREKELNMERKCSNEEDLIAALDKINSDSNETIAADLTKYNSPLDDKI